MVGDGDSIAVETCPSRVNNGDSASPVRLTSGRKPGGQAAAYLPKQLECSASPAVSAAATERPHAERQTEREGERGERMRNSGKQYKKKRGNWKAWREKLGGRNHTFALLFALPHLEITLALFRCSLMACSTSSAAISI